MLTIGEINLWAVAVPVKRGTRSSALREIPTGTSRTREKCAPGQWNIGQPRVRSGPSSKFNRSIVEIAGGLLS